MLANLDRARRAERDAIRLADEVAAHSLSADEVEAAFDRVYDLRERRDGSFEMFSLFKNPIWPSHLGDLAV